MKVSLREWILKYPKYLECFCNIYNTNFAFTLIRVLYNLNYDETKKPVIIFIYFFSLRTKNSKKMISLLTFSFNKK